MELSVPLDTICRIIVRARDLEVPEPAIPDDDGDEPNDGEDPAEVLDDANDEVQEEIAVLLDDLADDQLPELLALAWIGRGTYDASEWDEALEEAGELDRDDAADQLIDLSMLAAYLDAGLAAFDLSCDGVTLD